MLYNINEREYELSDQGEFTALMDVLCDYYHTKENELITDSEYDGLAAEYLRLFGISYDDYHLQHVNERDSKPKKKQQQIMTKVLKNEADSIEVDLPFFMPSLNKIIDSDTLMKWITRVILAGRLLIMLTNKMDGVSCLIVFDLSLLLHTNEDDQRQHCVYISRGSSRDTSGKRGRRMNHIRNASNPQIIQCRKNVLAYNKKTQHPIRAIRGELILTESNYQILQSRYPDKEFKNSRSAAAGIVSAMVNIVDEDIALLDFVAFRLHCGALPQHDSENDIDQMKEYEILKEMGFLRPTPTMVDKSLYSTTKPDFYGWLEKELEKRREEGDYDLDGLCLYAIGSGNHHHKPNKPSDDIKKPEFEIAVKFLGETAITTVTFVEWNPTKGGIFYPRIHFMPVQITDKNDNCKCAGYSARMIKQDCIGPGAKITVKKGGGILPIYVNCLEPAPDGPQFPDEEKQGTYTWDTNQVQLMIDDKEDNIEVLVKKVSKFFDQFKTFGIKGLGKVTSRKLLDEFGSLKRILLKGCKKSRLAVIPKFQEKTCETVSQAIQTCRDTEISLARAIAASCVYDKDFDQCRLELIFSVFPDVMEWNVSDEKNTEEENDCIFEGYKAKLVTIPGIKNKLAGYFLSRWMKVKKWLEEFDKILNISFRIGVLDEAENPERESQQDEKQDDVKDENLLLMATTSPAFPKIWKGKFVFTGLKRNKNMLNFLLKNGAKAVDCPMSKSVNCVIVNSHDDEPSSKVKSAQKWNIPVLTMEEFCHEYLQLDDTENVPW